MNIFNNTDVILSYSINLSNVTLCDNLGAGLTQAVNLQFGGWMHGLLDMYRQLERSVVVL